MDRLRAMEVFVKAVEAGSLSGAATQLDIANASVTTMLHHLEAHLGVTLLHRSTRHIRLTEDGAAYYERCKAILGAIVEAESNFGDGGLKGVLRLEAPIAFGHLIIAPSLARFAERHPELRVVISLSNVVDSLVRRGIDVAIRFDEVDTGDLVARPLYHGHHVLCAAPDFLKAAGEPAHPREIDAKRCLGFAAQPSGAVRPWRFRQEGATFELVPDSNLFFNSSDALMQTAARGAGMVYVLDVLAEQYLRRGELVRLLPDWETDGQSFYAIYPKTRFTPPKVHAIIEFLSGLFPSELMPRGPVPIRGQS
ncbi:MAG: LysR family transcriptional regulator [Rubritepida sp.]|nr:LysR family transcriptional regulator [Rubritepida sp.]